MKLAVLKERHDGERRVAASPETVKKLADLGFAVAVERAAGAEASMADDDYVQAGASLAADAAAALDAADVVLKVRPPSAAELGGMKSGALLVAMLDPYGAQERLASYASAGVTAVAMELMPRITRAQSMDVLSSQSNLAGYAAVLEAATHFGRILPMMMTAAGTLAPARAFIMGVGVAGLQAIATARRLGAVVSATDVRAAVKEQVESLGASFIMVEDADSGETEGGYAREMDADYQRRQAALIAAHIPRQDIIITTALIPGRPAPVLVSEEMVRSMRPGSVIVDLAAERGGNCALGEPGGEVVRHGVRIMAPLNMPGRLARDASALYARNLLHFLTPLVDAERKAVAIDWDDEIITATALTRGGRIIHPAFQPEGGAG